MNRRIGRRLWIPLLAGTSCQSPSPASLTPPMNVPHRILFVGNSLTYYNGGVENHVRRLAASATPPLSIIADAATQGGATLQILQGVPRVHDRIRDGHYDVVVLQDDLPELREHEVTPFLDQVRRFDREIREAGGRTVLFMAWPYERLNWIDLEGIEAAHRRISGELKLPIAPVGTAFQRSLQLRPDLAMLGPDREHETLRGTYLAACVLYPVLFGASPVGLPYHPDELPPEEAAFLQNVAWTTVREWNASR